MYYEVSIYYSIFITALCCVEMGVAKKIVVADENVFNVMELCVNTVQQNGNICSVH